MKFTYMSGAEFYKKGGLNKQVKKILEGAEEVGKIIQSVTGQEKYLAQLPYFAICEGCGKIYTTRSHSFEGKKVFYKCDQEFKGKSSITGRPITIKGCGHEGSVDYTKGQGKLIWKADFAARWAALKISFEAYGKDIETSVKANDEICRRVLGFEPPVHIMYELFLEKGGKKISKSVGNVFTPQVWYRYGTPQSLVLLMLKRFQGTRELDVTDIPRYMDEVNHLSKVYRKMEEADARDISNLSRLYEYIHWLRLPKKEVLIPYSVLTELAKILPEKGREDFALEKLEDFGFLKGASEEEKRAALDMVGMGIRWVQDFERPEMLRLEVTGENRKAIEDLISAIGKAEDGDALQSEIFEVANRSGMKPMSLFKAVYRILIGSDRGPKLGPYIIEIGKEEAIRKLRAAL
jgi:lysyl-tRNA synthetase class 1